MIISLLQEKGGAGKSTITINVAAAVRECGHKVLVVDSDQQRTARDWHTLNDGVTLDVIGLDGPTIDKDLKRFGHDYDYIFIDGAPRLSPITAKIIVASDVILIPVQPSPHDVWASENIVKLVKQRQEITGGKLKAAFIVSRQVTQTNIGKEFREALAAFELPVLTHGTFQRVAYPLSANEGKTVLSYAPINAQAGEEIRQLAIEIIEWVNV
jgi:chromosome partitioning protein